LDPTTGSGVAVAYTAEPITTKTFKRTPNAAISGHNLRHLVKVTPEDCKRECRKLAWCKSFDYHKDSNECDLSDVTAVEAGGLKTDYVGNPFDYYALVTQVSEKAVDAEVLLTKCETRAAGCWAKVSRGCKGDPASGFGDAWKRIQDFEGKARACGLMAAEIDDQCSVSPGTTEMRYVAAH